MNNYEFNTKSTYYVPPQAPKNRKILNMNKKDLSFLLVFFASIFIFIDFAFFLKNRNKLAYCCENPDFRLYAFALTI